jgi:ABC-2 type transport system permease protein
MKALSIARKSLLELIREPLLWWLLLLFPAAFVGFYYVAFGQTEGGMATYLGVLVVNDDAGTAAADGVLWRAGADLIDLIRGAEWEGDPIFDVEVMTDRRVAEIAVRERKASLLLAIPRDFTQTLVQGISATGGTSPATVSLIGDPGSESFVFAHSFLNWLVREFAKQAAGWQDTLQRISYEFLPGTGTMSDFDYGVIGLLVFGIMFVIITTATVMVRENVTGTLQRLRLTRASAADLLAGVSLAQMAAAAIQMPITFAAALVMGFHSNGSLLLAMGIGLLLNLSAVGLGLIVACFARNDGDAVNLASGVLVPTVFLSDALYPMPHAPLFTIAGRTIEAYDLLPVTHAAAALRRVLIFGEGVATITYELAAMTVLSLILLVVGVLLYGRLRLRKVSR